MDLTTATLQELKDYKDQVEPFTSEYEMVLNRITDLENDEPEQDPVDVMANEEIGLFGTPLGAFIPSEVTHVMVRKAILPTIYDLIEQLETTKAAKEINEENFRISIEKLSKELDECNAEITELKSAKYDAELLAEGNATKRDNAYNELQEARETIEELNAKLASANTVKPTYRTNVDGPEEVEVKKKRAIYDVEYLGSNGNRFKAKYADTDESFEDYTVYKAAKFTEVTAEEAPTFRTEYLAANPVEVETSSCGTVEMESEAVIPFRDDTTEENTEEGAGLELASEAPAVVGQVSRQEFEALKADFYDVKTRFFGNY